MNGGFNKKIAGCGCGILGLGCLGVVLVPILLIIVWLWAYQPYDLRTQSELNRGYETEFGEAPPTGVQVLRARQYVFADVGGQYMEMRMTTSEIDRHIQMGFKRVDEPPQGFAVSGRGNQPDWWKLPLPAETEYYTNESWRKGNWALSFASMAVNRKTGIVWLSVGKTD